MREINAIVIHCSATPNGDAKFDRDWIDREHRKGNPKTGKKPWSKIGYHYVVEVSGAVVVGRLVEEIGAHVAGNNAKSIGVCMVGTNQFTPEQWNALHGLVQDLQGKFPQAELYGHRDYSPDLDGDGLIEEWEWFKTCPGFDVKTWALSGMDSLWDPAHIYTKPAAEATV